MCAPATFTSLGNPSAASPPQLPKAWAASATCRCPSTPPDSAHGLPHQARHWGGLSTTQECCENGAGRTFISICTFPTSNSLFCIHVEDCPFSHCSSQTDDADQDAAGPDGQRRSPHNVLANEVGSSDSLCLGERWQDEVRRAHRAGPESGCRRAGAEGRVESEGVGREDLPRCRADRGRGRGQAAARPIDPERCLRDPVHGSELQDAQCVLRRSKRSRRC